MDVGNLYPGAEMIVRDGESLLPERVVEGGENGGFDFSSGGFKLLGRWLDDVVSEEL